MQRTRLGFQAAFLALTLVGVFAVGGNAERWCPFGGLETLDTYVTEGSLSCSLAVSNLYALAGLTITLLLVRRAFCSHVCPIGTLTEWTGLLRRRLGTHKWRVPDAADRALSLLKYGVLAFILWITWRADELLFRAADPCYALLSRHGEDITYWAYVVSGAIVFGALLTAVPFCRWLCPLAAAMNPLSRFGFLRVRRAESACKGCARCQTVCPMQIAVHERDEVREARCTACMQCISVCPTSEQGALVFGPPRRLGGAWSQRAVTAVLVVALVSVVTAAYALPVASFTKARGEPPATTEQLELRITGVKCRGSSTLLTWFLFRDDAFGVPGYVKVETWPQDGPARVRVTFDPTQATPALIQDAIATPYFDSFQGFDRESPFAIEGYAPWGQ